MKKKNKKKQSKKLPETPEVNTETVKTEENPFADEFTFTENPPEAEPRSARRKKAKEEKSADAESVEQAADAETADDAKAQTDKQDEEKAPKEEAPKKPATILSICLPLVIICIVVSLMLAAVNALTKDQIAQNAAAEKQNAVLAIFPDATYASLYESNGTNEVYLAIRENELIGFCISATDNGFGGVISLMVGRDVHGNVCGVEIVSMSETPGIGTKTKSPSFLNQYRGPLPFELGVNLDAISGATISSRAITRAVNTTLAIELDAQAIADAYGLSVHHSPTDCPDITDEQPPADTDTSDPTPGTDVPETDAPAADTTGTAEIPEVDPIERADDTNDVIVSVETNPPETDPPETEPEEITPETEPEETTPPETESEDTDEGTTAADTGVDDVPVEETTADLPDEADTSDETTGEDDSSDESSADTTGETQ